MGNIYYSGGSSLPPQYSEGRDGNIIVTGTNVNIADIYNNDNVTGVITHRGSNKGLNYSNGNPTGENAYNPQANQFENRGLNIPNCLNFTINSGASLIASSWNGTDNRKGVIWIAAIQQIYIAGTINVDQLAVAGASSPCYQQQGLTGAGVGYGGGGFSGGPGYGGPTGGTAGASYGDTQISTITWENIYGSSGGSGGATHAGFCGGFPFGGGGGHYSGHGGGGGFRSTGREGYTSSGTNTSTDCFWGSHGGAGGGAVRLYAASLIIDDSTGLITSDGTFGGSGTGQLQGDYASGGAGGGGSGGSIYIETVLGANIGTDKIRARGGTGGGCWNLSPTRYSNAGGYGSEGRVHIEGGYTGSTSFNPIE